MRIMPPTLFWMCILLMVPLAWVWPLVTVFPVPYNVFGVVPLCVGLAFAIWGSRKFDQVGTTVKTFDQPDRLVTDGLFRVSRNPMYLGMALVLLGIACLFGGLVPFLVLILFMGWVHRQFIRHEEAMLFTQFGQDWLEYKARVRRWI